MALAKKEEYLEKLKARAGESKVYRKFQLVGLQIADLLRDRAHKSLYIKLAKERRAEALYNLAARIAENKDIQKKGAYFMTLVKDIPKIKKKNGS